MTADEIKVVLYSVGGFNVSCNRSPDDQCPLAYPNGDYSDREVRLLEEAAYVCGVTMDAGVNDAHTDPFRLRRVALPDDAGINEVIVKASGLWALLKAFESKSANSRQHPTTSGDLDR